MNNNKKNLQKKMEYPKGQEIDVVELIHKVFKERKIIFKVCAIAAVIALIVGFSLPRVFTSEVLLAPEMTDGASGKSSLGGLAAIAGLALNTSSGADAYSPDLYPDIVESTPFLLDLLPLIIKTADQRELTVYEYLDKHQKSAWWSYIIKAPGKIMKWVRELFSSSPEILNLDGEKNGGPIYLLTKDQERIVENLKDHINVNVDKKTFVISISVKMQDPMVAALLTQEVLERLQDYIINYRTQKAKQDLEFTNMAYEEAKQRYFNIQRTYAAFEDANKHISTATYRTEQERLKNEMTLSYNLYNSLAQQREQDRLRVQEQTPVFALIEPTKVPLKPSGPRRMMILLGFIFLGGIGTAAYILIKDTLSNSDKEEQKL